jgi:hypothetical protein
LAISKRWKVTEGRQMVDDKFHWGLIDHALVGLKLTNLAEEMHESIRAEIGQIEFDNLRNSNSQAVPTLIIAMHLRRTNECIEKTYKAYCEVWEKQGGKKTADFVREVSANAIPVIISARTNAVIAGLSDRCARTGSPIEPHNARTESFKRSMNRLAARWARRLEIEAKSANTRRAPAAVSSIADLITEKISEGQSMAEGRRLNGSIVTWTTRRRPAHCRNLVNLSGSVSAL